MDRTLSVTVAHLNRIGFCEELSKCEQTRRSDSALIWSKAPNEDRACILGHAET